MITKEEKESWGEGEWLNEPDLVNWPAIPSGYPCVAMRHPALGYWLGYVGIPPRHPLHGAGLRDSVVRCFLRAHHETLDFADQCSGRQIAPLSEPPGYWWFGFNCGHPSQGDLAPGFLPAMRAARLPEHLLEVHEQYLADRAYRNLPYVTTQCESLAEQLHLAAIGIMR